MALLLAGGIAVAFHLAQDGRSKLARLSRSLEHRVVRGRLDGFAYAPPSANRTEARRSLRWKSLLAQIAGGGDPDETGGLAALLGGDAARAAAALESMAVERPSPQLWNDAAVARLEEAEQRSDAECYAMALAAADRALRLDSEYAPALFNRALALEGLQLRSFAANAYRRYLEVDGGSEWSVEARGRLEQLRKPARSEHWRAVEPELHAAVSRGDQMRVAFLVRTYPQQARTWAETEYLGRWGRAYASGRGEEAAAALATARAVGRELSPRGETLLADAVAAIDRSAPPTLLILARAHDTYQRGRRLYHERRISDSLDALGRAEEGFRAANSPMAFVAAYFRANAEFDAHQSERASRRLAEVLPHARDGYQALRAQVRWQQATIGARQGAVYEAVQYWREAAGLFSELGERDHATLVNQHAVTMLAVMGRHTEAWSVRTSLFSEASDSGNSLLLQATLNSCAFTEMLRKKSDVAASMLDLALAVPAPGPRYHFDALLWRSLIAANEGHDEAMNPDRLVLAAGRLPDPALREEALDDARFAAALWLKDRHPWKAEELLREVIAWRTASGRSSRLTEARLARARLLRAVGDDSAALAELDAAIAGVTAQRDAIADDTLRDSYLATVAEVFEEAADAAVALGDVPRAFALAEQGQDHAARSLGRPVVPAAAGGISKAIAGGTVLIEYVSTAKRTVLLAASAHGVEAIAIPVGRERLRREIAAFARFVADDDRQGIARQGRRLHEWLLAPALRSMNAATLVIVANDAVSGLPFAALRDEAGRLVVERHAVIVAPSASAFASAERTPGRVDRALFLAPSAPALLGLPPLADAVAEAHEASGFYGEATILRGPGATAERAIAHMADFDVVHFAAHALSHASDPMRSAIAMSGDGSSSLLYGKAIASLRLPRAPVVVLAACDSAAASAEGHRLRSLASAFVAAGSRSVVGSLWEVADAGSRTLMVAFHRELGSGRRPADALRSAQLSLFASGNRELNAPRTWSAYQVYGLE